MSPKHGTVLLSGGPARATLTGTKSVAAVAHVATFSHLVGDSVGLGCTLTATASASQPQPGIRSASTDTASRPAPDGWLIATAQVAVPSGRRPVSPPLDAKGWAAKL